MDACIAALCIAALAPISELYGDNSSTYKARHRVCTKIAIEAEYQGIDPAVMVSIGWVESAFTDTINKRTGAAGPLQVMRQYFCKTKQCDLIKAGVSAFRIWSSNRPLRESLCLYGSGRTCAKSAGARYYATKVIEKITEVRDAAFYECLIDGC